MKSNTKKELPVVSTIQDLADFIALYWMAQIEIGRFEMPFKGNNEMTDLVNIIRAVQVADDQKIFTDDQVDLIKRRTRIIVERELLKGSNLYAYTAYSSPHNYLKDMFEGIEIPHHRFPHEESIMYFKSLYDFEKMLNENLGRCGGEEGKLALRREYAFAGGLLCAYQGGGYWTPVAMLMFQSYPKK